MERLNINNKDFSFLVGIFTAFLCVIFGSNAVAIKFSFSGIGVFTTAAIRFSIAAIAIYIWARATGQSLMLKKGQLYQVLILGALFAVQLSMFYFGLSKSNASRGTLIVNLLPFWILFLAHFFIPGDRITRRKLFGILLGFSGVAFMFAEKKGVTADFRTGDLIILSATYHLVLQRNLPETNHQRLQRISNNPLFNGFFSARLFAGSPFVGCAHGI